MFVQSARDNPHTGGMHNAVDIDLRSLFQWLRFRCCVLDMMRSRQMLG